MDISCPCSALQAALTLAAGPSMLRKAPDGRPQEDPMSRADSPLADFAAAAIRRRVSGGAGCAVPVVSRLFAGFLGESGPNAADGRRVGGRVDAVR
jgi:hypothetical protein